MESPSASPRNKISCHQLTPNALRFVNTDRLDRRRRNTTARNALFSEPSNDEDKCFAKVSNLPKPFTHINRLISSIERLIMREGIVGPKDLPIKHCFDYDGLNNSILVQFASEEITQKVCALETIVFEKFHILTIEPYNIYNEKTIERTSSDEGITELDSFGEGNDEVLATSTPVLRRKECNLESASTECGEETDNTCKIVIQGLPAVFDEDLLKFIMMKILGEGNLLQHGVPAVMSVSKDLSHVTAQLANEKCAHYLANRPQVTYMGYPLDIQVGITETAKEQVASNHVVVSNLPEYFDKYMVEYLQEQVTKLLVECGERFVPIDGVCITSSKMQDNHTVLLEFVNSDCARFLASGGDLPFCGSDLKVDAIPTSRSSITSDLANLNVSTSEEDVAKDKVTVSGLVIGFDVKYLKFLLNKELWESRLAPTGEDHIESCIAATPTKVVMQFSKENEAASLKAKGELVWGLHKLTVSACSSVSNTKTTTLDDVSDKEFLKKLISLRHLFKGKRNHATAYATIVDEFEQVNVKCDISSVQKRRKAFLDRFNDKKRHNRSDADYWEVLCVLFGNASSEILQGEFKVSMEQPVLRRDPASTAAAAASFIGGAVFNVKSSLALLKIVRQHHDTLLHAKNPIRFWDEVSKILKDCYQYNMTGTRCMIRFQEVQRMYKEEVLRQGRTGEPNQDGPPWFWDIMSQLNEGNPASHPPATYAAGSTVKHVIRPKDSKLAYVHHESEDEDDCLQIEEGAVAQLKRPKSKKEQQNHGLQSLADAVRERNNLYRKRFNL